MEAKTPVDFFLYYCEPNMSKKDAEALLAQATFNTVEWLTVFRECRYAVEFRTMQILAMKKAVENASTLADWAAIAGSAHATGQLRKRAYEEILRFEPTGDDIQLLRKCASERLRSVGWYLSGRKARKL